MQNKYPSPFGTNRFGHVSIAHKRCNNALMEQRRCPKICVHLASGKVSNQATRTLSTWLPVAPSLQTGMTFDGRDKNQVAPRNQLAPEKHAIVFLARLPHDMSARHAIPTRNLP